MADAPIKGLTIKFGADTTDFVSRMSALGRIINNVQTQIRNMMNALRGDSTSVEGLTTRFNLLRTQAANTAVKVNTMRDAFRQMNEQGFDKIVAEIGNTALYVQRADAKVKRVNQELNTMYEELKMIGTEAGVAFNKKAKSDLDDWLARLKSSGNIYPELAQQAEKLVSKVKDLKVRHAELREEYDKAAQIRAYDVLKTDIVEADMKAQALAKDIVATREAIEETSAASQKLNRLDNELTEVRNEANRSDAELRQMNDTLRNTNYKNQEAFNRAIELTADRVKNAKRQVEILNEQLEMRKAQTGLERVEKTMTEINADIDEARAKAVKEEAELAKQSARVDELKQSYSSYVEKKKRGETLTYSEAVAQAELVHEIEKAEAEETKLIAKAGRANEELSMKKAIQGQKKLETELSETSARLTSLTAKAKGFGYALMNSLRDFATGLGATAGPALMMLGMHVVSAGDKIDSAFRDMKKTVDGTEEQFEELRKAAVDFSRTHPVSADTILEIEALGGQLGIAVDKLQKFGEIASNLDIATNISAETAATQLGQLNNILHWNELEFDDGRGAMERYGDALVRLGNNMPTQEDRISSITMAIASTGDIMGMTTPEILGWATAIAATGQGAESSGTAINNTMIDIEAAVGEGGDALEAFAEVAQMSAEEFAQKWKDKPSEAMEAFIRGLKEFDEAGGSATQKLDELEIRGVRQVRALLSLGNTIDIVRSAQEMANDAWENGGDAALEASRKAEGFSGKLAMLKNTAQTMGDAFAKKLVPLLDKLLDLAKIAANAIDNMSEEMATTIAVLGGLTVALAPVLRMFAQSKITLDAFKNAMGAAAIETKAMSAAGVASTTGIKGFVNAAKNGEKGAKTLAGKLGNLVNSFGLAKSAAVALAVLGIAVAAKALYDYIKKQEDFRKATDKLRESLYASSSAFGYTSTKLGVYSSAYVSAKDSVDALIEKQAKLYDELKKSSNETAIAIGMLDNWGEAIQKNNGVSDKNQAAVARLEDAVKHLNEQYNLGWQVVQKDGEAYVANADGIRIEIDAIKELIETKKHEAEVNAILSAQTELQKQRIEAEQTYAEARQATAVATENYNRALEENPRLANELYQSMVSAQDEEMKAKAALDGIDASLESLDAQLGRTASATDEHGKHILDMARKYPELAQQLDGISETAFPEFVDAVENAGFSIEDMESLTATEVKAMIESWKSGTDDWKKLLDGSMREMTETAKKSEDIGHNIAAGLADGIKKGSFLAINAARDAVADVIAKMNEEAATASPSKKTTWTGRMIGEGLALGMKKEEDAVEKQAAILASIATGQSAYGNSPSLDYLSGKAASSFGASTTTNNNSHETKYILSGDINITTQNGDPQEIVGEIVRLFSQAQAAYA